MCFCPLEKLEGEKLNVAEVTQSEIAQKQKLQTVLERINDALKVSTRSIKWNVDCRSQELQHFVQMILNKTRQVLCDVKYGLVLKRPLRQAVVHKMALQQSLFKVLLMGVSHSFEFQRLGKHFR